MGTSEGLRRSHMMGTGKGLRLKLPYYKVYEFLQCGSYDADADEQEREQVAREERHWRAMKDGRLRLIERERINGHHCIGQPNHLVPNEHHKCPYRRDIDGSGMGCLCCDHCVSKCQRDANQEQMNIDRNWTTGWDTSTTAATNSYHYIDLSTDTSNG
jgi:hypothetical protein